MTRYEEWNTAIFRYLTSGLSKGQIVYINIESDTLMQISTRLMEETFQPDFNYLDDLKQAIRSLIVQEDRLNLDIISGKNSQGIPKGLAFLCLSVLAAYEMVTEEEISELNYFSRLRDLLGMPLEKGRPLGMEVGKEEKLWKDWNTWLLEHGYQHSAFQGRSKSQKYINYPISQCLLRKADKEKLVSLFQEKRWNLNWSPQTIIWKLKQEQSRLSKHTQEVLSSRRSHDEVFIDAVYEVYESYLYEVYESYLEVSKSTTTDRSKTTQNNHLVSGNLLAGLYREQDPLSKEGDYYIYPKQRRGHNIPSIEIDLGNRTDRLFEERSGWYHPLDVSLDDKSLSQGANYKIVGNPDLKEIILPKREFWILVPDEDSGIYASWGVPDLGTSFILLFKQHLKTDLERLRDEKLIEWDNEVPAFPGWYEVEQCMVVSQAWDGVFIESQELKDALQPRTKLSISFSGGLRVPEQRHWLAGYPPVVTIFGFCSQVDVEIRDWTTDRVLQTYQQKTNEPHPLPIEDSGNYLIRATDGKNSTEKFLKIVSWSELEVAEFERREVTQLDTQFSICGAVIEDRKVEK